MMSLPFLLFACGLAAAWTSRREAAMGFWLVSSMNAAAMFLVTTVGGALLAAVLLWPPRR